MKTTVILEDGKTGEVICRYFTTKAHAKALIKEYQRYGDLYKVYEQAVSLRSPCA